MPSYTSERINAMTLAIAVATADGIVVAADSRTSGAPAQPQYRVMSDYTHKVFSTNECAVATYGFAFIMMRNIAGHMGEFTREMTDRGAMDPAELAAELARFFGDRLDEHFNTQGDPRPEGDAIALGFLVGGYSGGLGSIYEVALPTRPITTVASTAVGGAAWRGQTDVVVRLVKGVDLDCAARAAVGDAETTAKIEELVPHLTKNEYVILFGSMNLQDAVDFAVLAIRTTIDVQRLTHGTVGNVGSWPGVGGPIEIAAVLPTGGVRWVQQTQLQGERSAGVAELS
jgi:hypothetical protein